MSNKDIFLDYVDSFKKDEEINRKVEHSFRVSKLCREIACYLGVNDELVDIAEFIGLTHDLGRFLQWSKYHTFKDKDSIDHAILSSEILFRDGYINRFNVNHKWDNMIKNAIENHSRYEISGDVIDDDELLMAKIIRDADKIDILFSLSNGDIDIKEDNERISVSVIEEFLNKKSIKHNLVNNLSDDILLKMGIIFNLYFDISLEIIYKNEVLDKIYDKIKYKDKIEPYYEFIKKYIKDSI